MELTIHLTPDEENVVRAAMERGIDVEKKVRDTLRALKTSRPTASGLNGDSTAHRSSTARLLQS